MHGCSRFTLALAALVALFASACSLSSSSNPYSKIKIRIASEPASALSPFGSFGSVSPPSSVSGFDCLGVNVMGVGIPPIQHTCGCTGANCNCGQEDIDTYQNHLPEILSGQTYCAYPGVTSTPISNTSGVKTVNLSVPSGPQRLVEMVGIMDPTNSVCGATAPLGDDDGGNANYFEIGRAIVDLFSSQSVSIPDTYDTLTAAVQSSHQLNCGDGSGSTYFRKILSEPSLAVYWPMYEPTIGTAYVSGPQESLFNTLTESATLTSTVGPLLDSQDTGDNFALKFSGSVSDSLAATMNGSASFAQMTVEMWVNFPAGASCAGGPPLFSLGTGPTYVYLYCQTNGSLGVQFSSADQVAGDTTSGINIIDGKWHLIDAVWTAPSTPGLPNIFVDGLNYSSGTGTPIVLVPMTFGSGTSIAVSSNSPELPAGTSVGQLALYTSALTKAQAQAHFAAAGH